ncbi:MAG: MraY family glycosyltransferase [Patescibacteria group bacterium]
MFYLGCFLLAGALTAALTPLVIRLARAWGAMDMPGDPRKIHKRPTPLLGGIAVWASFCGVLFFATVFSPDFLGGTLGGKQLFGLGFGGLLLMIGGALDDRYNLKPGWQFFFSILAAVAVIGSGIGIREITNPFGGVFDLVWWEKTLFWYQDVGYRLSFPADILTFAWILGMIYATKFLDGVDGLVSGVTAIGVLVIMFLATTTKYYQPEVGILSAIAAGAFVGFLIWNWHPAKIFLGTGGSTLAGFLLGSLAIVSGGKIATALLVMGAPLFDMVWVIFRRALAERRWPTIGDRKHLHHRLLDAGLGQRGTALVLYLISAVFGVTALFLQSREKLIALGILFVFLFIVAIWILHRKKEIRLS